MSQQIPRASRIGACCGLVISVLVLAYGYLESHTRFPALNDWLIFIACPSSILLMAADNATLPLGILADLMVALVNAIWYGILFTVAAMLFRKRAINARPRLQ
jgi:hypothetical protein